MPLETLVLSTSLTSNVAKSTSSPQFLAPNSTPLTPSLLSRFPTISPSMRSALQLSSGVLRTYESALDKGLIVFAPSDEAFKAEGVPNLSKLTNAEQVSLLEYHASLNYKPKGTLKTTTDPIITTAGDSVTLHTGVGPSRVAEAVFDSPPVAIFTVDNVLLPSELFGKSPSPAPTPEPVSSPSRHHLYLQAHLQTSPPAPPIGTPVGSPADALAGSSENSTSDNAAGHVSAPLLGTIIFTVFAAVVSSVILSES
ncbi:hypothetical protein J1N35_020625 [Gossypium stocksii]|uniref:FAS1 domain-containing protein n=1 Tax=Gossypium stocksii TaxID=47602 RepID=A0A9D3VEB4_9ROSI|nr:hypothetical protein J1N35_020625 [Gossypium stocksii]